LSGRYLETTSALLHYASFSPAGKSTEEEVMDMLIETLPGAKAGCCNREADK